MIGTAINANTTIMMAFKSASFEILFFLLRFGVAGCSFHRAREMGVMMSGFIELSRSVSSAARSVLRRAASRICS